MELIVQGSWVDFSGWKMANWHTEAVVAQEHKLQHMSSHLDLLRLVCTERRRKRVNGSGGLTKITHFILKRSTESRPTKEQLGNPATSLQSTTYQGNQCSQFSTYRRWCIKAAAYVQFFSFWAASMIQVRLSSILRAAYDKLYAKS